MAQAISKGSRIEEIERVWKPEAKLWTPIGDVSCIKTPVYTTTEF
jgi:hypothetical protein